MTENEYEKIYESAPVGFMFNCTRHHLSRSIPLTATEVGELPAWCGNSDQLFIKCKPCDMLMIFTGESTELLDGKWACPNCGRIVREETPYNELDKENHAFEERWLNE